MRRAIETASRDGKAILLEDDASGEYAVARWSAEANDWVGESGEPIEIAATHWYAMPPPSWARRLGVFAFSSNQARQPKVSDPLREAVNATPVDTIEAWAMPVEDRPIPKVRRRVAALLTIATLLMMAPVGVSLGILGGPAKVRAPLSQSEVPQQAASLEQDIVPKPRTDFDGYHLPATAQTTGLATQSLEKEQRPETLADELAKAQRIIRELNLQLREQASELAIARRETEMHAAQSSRTADEKAQLKQATDSTAALARELASQLAMTRREIDAHVAPARDASAEAAQIKQTAESTAAELRLSLQQQRDRAEALARDLASARREIEAQATPARDARAEAAQIKQTAESTAEELRQSLQQERDRAEALARDLASVRREIEAQATLARDARAEAAQIRQAAESSAEELRHSLQQERDRAKAWRDLAATRREIDTHAKPSSKAATEVKHTKRHLQRKRDRDFELGPAQLFRIFRSAPAPRVKPTVPKSKTFRHEFG